MARMPYGVVVGRALAPVANLPQPVGVKASMITASRSLRGDFDMSHDTRLLSGIRTAPTRRNNDNYTPNAGTVKNRPGDLTRRRMDGSIEPSGPVQQTA
jgi:hypothetical protein